MEKWDPGLEAPPWLGAADGLLAGWEQGLPWELAAVGTGVVGPASLPSWASEASSWGLKPPRWLCEAGQLRPAGNSWAADSRQQLQCRAATLRLKALKGPRRERAGWHGAVPCPVNGPGSGASKHPDL